MLRRILIGMSMGLAVGAMVWVTNPCFGDENDSSNSNRSDRAQNADQNQDRSGRDQNQRDQNQRDENQNDQSRNENNDATHHAALGVSLSDSDGRVTVLAVMPGSPAAKAGLRPGDEIRSVDDQRVRSAHELMDEISQNKPGSRVDIAIRRDGEKQTLHATLGSRETAFASNNRRERTAYSYGSNNRQNSGWQQQNGSGRQNDGMQQQMRQRLEGLQQQVSQLQRQINALQTSLNSESQYQNQQYSGQRASYSGQQGTYNGQQASAQQGYYNGQYTNGYDGNGYNGQYNSGYNGQYGNGQYYDNRGQMLDRTGLRASSNRGVSRDHGPRETVNGNNADED